MDTISHDAKPANLCIYAAFPAVELKIEARNGFLRLFYLDGAGERAYLNAIDMELWLFHYPEQGLEAARTAFPRADVDALKKLIERPRPWVATHHFDKLELRCEIHGDRCYKFRYEAGPAPDFEATFEATKNEWEKEKTNPNVTLDLFKKVNALDDLVLGTFEEVHFARIPFLSVPIAALFQPCLARHGAIVRTNFLGSLRTLRRAAPIYALSAIREVAEYYAMRVDGTLNDCMVGKAASLCVDLAIASVLFPVRIKLRGMENGYASTSLKGKAYETWEVKSDENGPIVFLDHHNWYLDGTGARCFKASDMKGSAMFLASIKDIEEALADVISQSRRRQYSGYSERTEVRYVMFELFMPLAREDQLRTALDGLFYRDRILRMLDVIDGAELRDGFGAEEDFRELSGYVCEWIGRNFVGYSISHVAGRYRAHHLKEFREAVVPDVNSSTRYLIDETTAAVRFIFPCPVTSKAVKAHADKVRFIFMRIFVKQMLESVEKENEIWLVESGMQNRLYRWEKRPDQKEGDPGTEEG